MFQKSAHAESSTLSTLGFYPQSDFSLSDRVTATTSVKRQLRFSYQAYKGMLSLQRSFKY